MKKFQYWARDLNGKRVKGTFISENEDDMKKSLAKSNLFLERYKQLSNKKPNAFFSVTGKVSINELCNFCKQFSVMITSGITVIDCLKILKTQSYSGLMKKSLDKVEEDVKAGLSLSDSMRKHPKVFPNFFVSMVYIGETSGQLDSILLSVSDYYTRRQKNAKKIKSALAYPIMLLVLTLAVIVIMMNFVIPTFITTFEQMPDVEMPALTMALFNMSNFMRDNWKMIFLTIFGIGLLIYVVGKISWGRYFYDWLKVKIPIVKQITMATFNSTLTQSLGLLLSGGLDLVSSLDAITKIIDNKYLAKQFTTMKKDVEKGLPLSQSLDINMKLSPILIQMIMVGEKAGNIDKILLQTYDYFDQQIDSALNLISTIIQPVILIFMGGAIATIFLAIYMPILSMITATKV